jgi:hypothetical protein
VSSSAYYAWLSKPIKRINAQEKLLELKMKTLFKTSRQSLGN